MDLLERGITQHVEPRNEPTALQRLRLTFGKEGAARYISHLDLARALERALNRAGLPVAYTQGFNRRPRLSLAAALPLGYTSDAEVADVWLTEPVAPEGFRSQLMRKMAPGISVKSVVEVPIASPSLQQLMAESVYQVNFPDPVDEMTLRSRVAAMLVATSVVHERFRSRGAQPQFVDLRPLILDVKVVNEGVASPYLLLRVVQTVSRSGRPDDILAALGYDPLAVRVHRIELRFNNFAQPST